VLKEALTWLHSIVGGRPLHEFFEQLNNFVQQSGAVQALAFLTAAGAVLVSLLTAIVAPAVAIYVARRQIRATVVSTNRQKWIDNLRDALAELIAVHLVAFSTKKLSDPEISTKVFHLQNKILLLTNPAESDHVKLTDIIEKIINSSPNDPNVDVWELQRQMIEISRRILKTEWVRVRRGD
jgi:hypothetical protein